MTQDTPSHSWRRPARLHNPLIVLPYCTAAVPLAQYEVAWTLTNICSAEHEDCRDVCDQGGVPEFVRLLGCCDDVEVLEQVGGWCCATLFV